MVYFITNHFLPFYFLWNFEIVGLKETFFRIKAYRVLILVICNLSNILQSFDTINSMFIARNIYSYLIAWTKQIYIKEVLHEYTHKDLQLECRKSYKSENCRKIWKLDHIKVILVASIGKESIIEYHSSVNTKF